VSSDVTAGAGRQRLDKWLWHARLARTRTAAQKLARSGKVRLNRDKISESSRLVRPGDVLTVPFGATVRILKVTALAERRGPAGDARLLYQDMSPKGHEHPPVPMTARGGGRPTKRDRRAFEAFRYARDQGDDDIPDAGD
jgi:ribosome-associated heat shock protein Hsp15